MKKYLIIVMFLLSQAPAVAGDWRVTGSSQKKIDNLVKIMPSASGSMLQMGERYRNVFWAALQENWLFAEYQAKKMQEQVNVLMVSNPELKPASEQFLQKGMNQLIPAIQSKNWTEFKNAFMQMRQACNECHEQNKLGFITLREKPAKGISPVLH